MSHLIPRPLHPYLREPSFHHPGWVLQSRHVQLWLSGWSHHSHSSDRETGAWGIAVCAWSREARRVCGSVRKSPGLPPEASTWDQTQSLLNSDAQSLSRAGGLHSPCPEQAPMWEIWAGLVLCAHGHCVTAWLPGMGTSCGLTLLAWFLLNSLGKGHVTPDP